MADNRGFALGEGYEYLLERFGKDKILARYDFIFKVLQDYIIQNKYQDQVVISEDIIEHVVVDYFVDIARLKDFQEIIFTNQIKIYAYMSFWLLRHKPLQLKAGNGAENLVFVNEAFVSDLIKSFLFSDPEDVPLVTEKREDIDEFVRTMEYFFCYREYSAKAIELMLLAFLAGRGYQYSVDYQK